MQVTSLDRKGRRSPQGKGVSDSKTQHRVVGSSRLCRDSGILCRSGICGLYHVVEFIPRTVTGRAHLLRWTTSLGSVARARWLDVIGYPSAGCGVQRNRKAQGNVKDWKHMQQVRRKHHTSRAPIPGWRARVLAVLTVVWMATPGDTRHSKTRSLPCWRWLTCGIKHCVNRRNSPISSLHIASRFA